MKRWIAMMLAAVLVFGCVSLGLSMKAQAAGNEPALAKITLGSGAQTEEEAEEKDPDDLEVVLEPGVIEGNIYENASLNLGCQLEDGWEFLNEDEIAELNGTVSEQLEDFDYAALLESGDTYTDMYAMGGSGLYMIGVQVEKIDATLSRLIDEDGYADLAMSLLQDNMDQFGLSDYTMEKATVNFCGEDRPAINVTGSVMGVADLYQYQVLIKRGDYMVLVMLQSVGEDIREEIGRCFYFLDQRPEDVEEPVEEDEAIHFIDAMGSDGTPAYIDLIGISDWVYRDGDKRYYAAEDESYLYIVSVTEDQLAEMSEEQVYWGRDEDSEDPPVYHLTGTMGTIDSEVREAFKTVFEIDDTDFDYYFGDDYLDATAAP